MSIGSGLGLVYLFAIITSSSSPRRLVSIQRRMYAGVDQSDESMVKAVESTRELDLAMAKLGAAIFNDTFRKQYMKKVEDSDAKLKAVSESKSKG